jgi:predicted Mrr-cat superfamily restriction endonuclease
MKQIFQLKSRPHGIERGKLFLDEGFVCIGWPGIGNLEGINREGIRERLEQAYGYTGQQLGAYTGAVNTFVNVIQERDIILVPVGVIVHIGIVGPYYYESAYDNQEGMCHRRSVEWIATVAKSNLNHNVIEFVKNRGIITKFSGTFEEAELGVFLDLESDESNPFVLSPAKESSLKSELFSEDIQNKAKEVIMSLLESKDPEMRFKAAAEILRVSQTH